MGTSAFDPSSFSLRLANKDAVLALDLAKELGVPMQFSELALKEPSAKDPSPVANRVVAALLIGLAAFLVAECVRAVRRPATAASA